MRCAAYKTPLLSPYSTGNTLPNANEMDTKNMKCTWPTRDQTPRTQRKLYSTGWRWGLASGITQILALGNAKIYQHVGILALGDAEVLSFALGDAKVPHARYFAFWWNIGFIHLFIHYFVFNHNHVYMTLSVGRLLYSQLSNYNNIIHYITNYSLALIERSWRSVMGMPKLK